MTSTKRNFPAFATPAALCAIALPCVLAFIGLSAAASPGASLSRSIDVKGTPRTVWGIIGGYCAIGEWHPAIGSCTEDGRSPPTRTLHTKDGATFVELQTGRSDRTFRYSYTFTSSPVPVTHYVSTFKVVAKTRNTSTVIWTGVYLPDPGKEKAARDALNGIYESGLTAIRAKLAS